MLIFWCVCVCACACVLVCVSLSYLCWYGKSLKRPHNSSDMQALHSIRDRDGSSTWSAMLRKQLSSVSCHDHTIHMNQVLAITYFRDNSGKTALITFYNNLRSSNVSQSQSHHFLLTILSLTSALLSALPSFWCFEEKENRI